MVIESYNYRINNCWNKINYLKKNKNKKTLNWKLYKDGGIDTNRFKDFLEQITTNSQDKLIIMDNASSHTAT